MGSNHRSKKSSRAERTLIFVLTPVLMLIALAAIVAIIGSIPYSKVSATVNMIFNAGSTHASINAIELNEREPIYDEEGKIVFPYFGEQYATLKADVLGEVPVFYGSNTQLLRQGACQFTGSVFIGQEGNVVIDAHCNTHFLKLGEMKVGDKVTLTTAYGEFVYEVTSTTTFLNNDNSLISPTSDDILTLYTCKPEGSLLGATNVRYAVICKSMEKNFKEYVRVEVTE